MTKIYEALENASKERSGATAGPGAVPSLGSLPKSLVEKLLSLSHRIEALLEEQKSAVVEFVGAQPGDDSSRLALQVAKLAASQRGRKVLFLATRPQPHLARVSGALGSESWEAVLEGSTPIEAVLHEVGPGSLSISQIATTDLAIPGLLAAPGLPALMRDLREKFDLIVIDASPFSNSSSPVLLSAIADGVVFVIEAGKTRWQAIKYVMDQMTAQGSKTLGVVFTRQRFYIPNFIYRKL